MSERALSHHDEPTGEEASTAPSAPVGAVSPAGRARRTRPLIRAGQHVWLLVLIGAIWEVVGRTAESVFFPPLSAILANYVDIWLAPNPLQLLHSDFFWEQAGVTLGRFAAGWSLAVGAGIAIGVALGTSRRLTLMYSPVVRFFVSLPSTLLLPIAVQIFGVASGMNVFLIFVGSVWVIIINAADGVGSVDEMWIRSARSLRVSKLTLYRHVILPAAMPQILTGVRVGLGIGLILMVVAELYATTSGLGYQIVVASSSFRYLDMWSAFVVIAIIGIILNWLFVRLERRCLRWQRRGNLGAL